MFRLLALLLLICSIIGNFALQKSYEGYRAFEVSPENIEQIKILKNLRRDVKNFDFWEEISRQYGRPTRFMVSPEKIEFTEKLLLENNVKYVTIMENVEKDFQRSRATNDMRRKLKHLNQKADDDYDITYFWTLDEIYSYLDGLAEKHSQIEVEVIGKSYEGRDIKAAKITLGEGGVDGTRPNIIIDGTIHAKEWIGTMVVVALIHELIENASNNADILTDIDWIIVPVANPDGYVYAHETDRLWRKTRYPNPGSDCVGVDPNRNFDIEWDVASFQPDPTIRDPCDNIYHGQYGNSQMEVQALGNLMKRYENSQLYVSVHSFGTIILYPHAFGPNSKPTDEPIYVKNREEHLEVGQRVVDKIFEISGVEYDLNNVGEVFDQAGGGSDDYANLIGKINLAFTFELPRSNGTNGHEFEPERIESVVEYMVPAFREFGYFIVEKYAHKNVIKIVNHNEN